MSRQLVGLSVNSGCPEPCMVRAGPVLLLRGLPAGERLLALFSLQRNSLRIKSAWSSVPVVSMWLPSWTLQVRESVCQLESASLLNASAQCKSACCHIILPLVVLDGCFMGLKWQPVVIALYCPMRLSHKIVVAVTSILRVCRADTAQVCWKH